MAVVYRAHDLKHDRPVAVKVMRPEIAAAMGRERFLSEISIAAKLQHPHVLSLIDSGDVDGQLYYVMRERASVQSFASGVTAAAIGALLGAVAVMTTRTLVDVTAIAISIAALAVLVLRPKFPEPALLAAAAAAGVILR